jgi:hypothetical protein
MQTCVLISLAAKRLEIRARFAVKNYIALGILLAIIAATPLQGQTGFPPFNTFNQDQLDTVNVFNLNVHFSIPIITKAGRGGPFTYALTYDNSIWSPNQLGTAWKNDPNWGWVGVTDATFGKVKSPVATTISCNQVVKGKMWDGFHL